MRKSLVLLSIGMTVALIGMFGQAQPGNAAFHIMRVYGVTGGAFGNANVQYVELRMADAGQSLVSGHVICFFDGTGAPYARFQFPSNVSNSADEASILVGSAEFDAAWAAGSVDGTPSFLFSASTTVAIQAGADVNHPVRTPAGKVAFGSDSQTTPSLMCQAGFTGINTIDSVAYGTGYTGTVDFGTKLNSDLPTAGTTAARLQGPICFPGAFSTPCASPRNNSVDYALTDVNTAGNNPRNNSNQSGPISAPDSDGDGVPDASDNCPRWANPAQNSPLWPVPPNDPDCDGFSNTTETDPDIGTDPNDPCANTATANDENPDDKWPADFNDNQVVNTLDLTVYATAFNKLSTDPGYVSRADLNQNGVINSLDLVPYAAMLNKVCLM